MAYNANRKPEQDPSAGKSNKTPAPVTKETAFGRENYGANAFGGASSIEPGKTVTSPLADDLKQSSNDGESVLDHVIAKGTAMPSPDWQTRAIDTAQKVPTTFGHKNPNASPASVPAKTGAKAGNA